MVKALKKSGANERQFFWDRKSPVEADSTVCATFASGGGLDQQGVVLRLNDATDDLTGITVTRNVFAYDFQTFNFHDWNTGSDPSSPFTQFGSVTISALPYAPAAYPLSLCARTVSATDEVQFVVWTAGMKQPTWGDPTWGGEATIPAGAPTSGQGGFFVGHVRPGMPTTFTNLSVDAEALLVPTREELRADERRLQATSVPDRTRHRLRHPVRTRLVIGSEVCFRASPREPTVWRKARTAVLNSSGRSMLLACPALSMTIFLAPGILFAMYSAASKNGRSSDPTSTRVGTRTSGSESITWLFCCVRIPRAARARPLGL